MLLTYSRPAVAVTEHVPAAHRVNTESSHRIFVGGTSIISVNDLTWLMTARKALTLYATSELAVRITEAWLGMVLGSHPLPIVSVNGKYDAQATASVASPLRHIIRRQTRAAFLTGEFVSVLTRDGGKLSVNYIDPASVQITADDLASTVPVVIAQAEVNETVLPVVMDINGELSQANEFLLYGWWIEPTSGIRGMSGLRTLVDLLQRMEENIDTQMISGIASSTTFWETVLNGADYRRISEWFKSPDSVPPAAGDHIAHNESVAWNLRSGQENLKTNIDPMAATSRTLETAMFLAGVVPFQQRGTRNIWTDDISGLAYSAQEAIERYYSALTHILLLNLTATGRLPDKDYQISFALPDVDAQKQQRLAGAMVRIVTALEKTEQNGWLTSEEVKHVARRLWGYER